MIPTALRVVALLHFVGGLASAVGMLVQLTYGHINIDFGVLGIPMYFGLMRLDSGWRTCALVFVWMSIVAAPFVFFIGLSAEVPAYFQAFGVSLATVSPVWLSVTTVPFFLLSLWEYRVLTRRDVRSLFCIPEPVMTAHEPPQPIR